ncbi:MAG: carbohydrate porin [Burkholderiaceae bacterium]
MTERFKEHQFVAGAVLARHPQAHGARWPQRVCRNVVQGMVAAALLSMAGQANASDEPVPRYTIEGALTGLAQSVNGAGSATGKSQTRLGYRGDLVATINTPGLRGGDGTLNLHLRFGQGEGVSTRDTYTGAVNSLAFSSAAGSSNAVGVLAQAYYETSFPVGQSGMSARISVGKLDPFGFFDQNAIADDESAGFLNNVFVHNPMLDSGGDISADDYGFTPGLVLAFGGTASATRSWGVSAGVFAAGDGTTFDASPRRPWWLVQAESSRLDADGEPVGTWRLLFWQNRQSEDLNGNTQTHSGWGLSADERILDDLTMFARLGQRTSGVASFDWAVTTGLEWQAGRMGRPDDALGFALGSLHTDKAYRDHTANGTAVGYAASGRESSMELFYRIGLGEGFHVSPSVQWVRRPGGDPNAGTVRVIGLRANVSF